MSACNITDRETGQQRESLRLPSDLAAPPFQSGDFRQEVPTLLRKRKVVGISPQPAAESAAAHPTRR
ncbi:MAG: hypothetical protein ACK6D5_10765, partial [Planctomyces sp.]